MSSFWIRFAASTPPTVVSTMEYRAASDTEMRIRGRIIETRYGILQKHSIVATPRPRAARINEPRPLLGAPDMPIVRS